jgi:hypothetical protein
MHDMGYFVSGATPIIECLGVIMAVGVGAFIFMGIAK